MRVTLLLAAFAPAAAGRVVLDPEAERGANPSINVAARGGGRAAPALGARRPCRDGQQPCGGGPRAARAPQPATGWLLVNLLLYAVTQVQSELWTTENSLIPDVG